MIFNNSISILFWKTELRSYFKFRLNDIVVAQEMLFLIIWWTYKLITFSIIKWTWNQSLAVWINIIWNSKYIMRWYFIFRSCSFLPLVVEIFSTYLILQLLSAYNYILTWLFRFYCYFIWFVRDSILHVVNEHMLFLIYSTLKINIPSKIVRLMNIICIVRLLTWGSIDLFIFNLKHACISRILSQLQRYSLSYLFVVVQLNEIWISTKYFRRLIRISWIIWLTVNRRDVMNVF